MYKDIIFWILVVLMKPSNEQFQYLGGFNPNTYGKQEWKSIVVIEFDSTHVCSGSVVDKEFVITAAHCVDRNFSNNIPFKNSILTCRVGGFINELADTVIPVDSVYYHPNYNLTAGIADIALLKLKFPVRPGVKNVNLPNTQLAYGVQCHLVGWRDLEYDLNMTKRIASIVPLPKRAIYVSDQALMDLSACEDALREINFELYNEVMSNQVNIISPTSLCTKSKPIDPSKINDSFTDSGGPVVCEDNLQGVQSFMLEMKDGRTFFVSTRVDKYIDWILKLTKQEKRAEPNMPMILTEEDLVKEGQLKQDRGLQKKEQFESEDDNKTDNIGTEKETELIQQTGYAETNFGRFIFVTIFCLLQIFFT